VLLRSQVATRTAGAGGRADEGDEPYGGQMRMMLKLSRSPDVPPTAWWTRVGTIVPRSYWDNPDRLGEYTLELVREGLVDQFRPEWAGRSLGENFSRFLHRLSEGEIDDRRRRLRNGQVAFVHRDKFRACRWCNKWALHCLAIILRMTNARTGWRWSSVRPTSSWLPSPWRCARTPAGLMVGPMATRCGRQPGSQQLTRLRRFRSFWPGLSHYRREEISEE
jgi:hypothetical protein